MTKLKLVLDTNILISSILISASTPDLALQKARKIGRLLFSDITFDELSQVLFRPKFDKYKYISINIRTEFITRLGEDSERVEITENVTVCRDPKDNKFLEVALNGCVDYLITGDQDLLVLNPFHGIKILSPAEFLIRS